MTTLSWYNESSDPRLPGKRSVAPCLVAVSCDPRRMRVTALPATRLEMTGNIRHRVLRASGLLMMTMLFGSLAMAGDFGYGEHPLRSNLSDLPFARTEEGRAGHRFASAEINRYRLYDFYVRQARWYVDHPDDPTVVLLPFPGLDGGRRGHWAATNESSTAAYPRTVAAEFGLVTARGGDWGMHYVRGGSQAPDAILFYDTRAPGVRQALSQASLQSFGGAGPGKVDRWGLNLRVDGKRWYGGADGAWLSAGSTPASYVGHYLHGDQVIYRLAAGAAVICESPSVIRLAGSMAIRRVVASSAMAEPLTMKLDNEPMTAQPIPGGFLCAVGQGDQRRFHLVFSRGKVAGGEMKMRPSADNRGIVIERAAGDMHMEVISGVLGTDSTPTLVAAARALPQVPVLKLMAGGPARWPTAIMTTGQRNADPAAGRTAYEVDDLPVPSDNPWNTPMTISGIDFSADGTLFVCTLVGDVWRVSGLDAGLKRVSWRRIASGLNLPLGIKVVGGTPYLNCRGQMLKLMDLNGDQEVDYLERFSSMELPASESGHDLQCDAEGNFYFNANQGIFRLSSDGKRLDKVGGGSRNPLGLGIRPDGLALSDSSEGESNNGTCTIYESDHAENSATCGKAKRILYLPRGIDSSPGSRIFLHEPRFGPLGKHLLGVSYGTGTWYLILRDAGAGTPQAAVMPLPGEFASGTMRIRCNPADGQLYVAGLDGWGDYAVAEGCLHRIRFAERATLLPTAWEAHANGVMLHFDQELEAPGNPTGFFAQQWNVLDSQHTYGSTEYSVKIPGAIGHDRLTITRVMLGEDKRSIFIEMPTIRPAACTQLHGTLRARSGATLELDLYATINALRPDWGAAVTSEADKPDKLVLPEKGNAGNTYQAIVEFFDRASGRASVPRPAAPEVPWKPDDLSYEWIRKNVIESQCLPCHAKGTPNDYTTYEGLVRKINRESPDKSHLVGMIMSNSMPPFPLPTVAPGVQKAIAEWVRRGAQR